MQIVSWVGFYYSSTQTQTHARAFKCTPYKTAN